MNKTAAKSTREARKKSSKALDKSEKNAPLLFVTVYGKGIRIVVKGRGISVPIVVAEDFANAILSQVRLLRVG